MYDRFIARQPILDTRLQVWGYELLFRESDTKDTFKASSATSHVIANSTMVFNWSDLVGNTRAFLNFSGSELVSGAALLLPRKQTVIEILESTVVTSEVVAACERLRAMGYALALDGFADLPEQRPLVPICSYLKVDFRTTTPELQAEIGRKYASKVSTEPKLVAKKTETWDEYDRARKLHYSLFQGFFFLEPQILRRRGIPSSKMNALQLLTTVQHNPLNIPAVESILKHDPGLTFKLLRYLNSPIMERRAEIRSVANAIALLGEPVFRRWATLVAVITPSVEKPNELIHMALTRAFLCEEIAQRMGQRENIYEFFLVGLLSLTPAILDQPLNHIVAELPLSNDVGAALRGEPSSLRCALDAVLAYEQAQWPEFVTHMERLALPEDAMPACFAAANQAARDVIGAS